MPGSLLWNTQTQRQEWISEADLPAALSSDIYRTYSGSGTTRASTGGVVSAEALPTTTAAGVATTNLPAAEGAEARRHAEAVAAHDNLADELLTAVDGSIQTATVGLLDGTGIGGEQQQALRAEANPWAHASGALVTALASMKVPVGLATPVSEGALALGARVEGAIAGKVLGRTAGLASAGAAEGLAYGAGAQVSNAINDRPVSGAAIVDSIGLGGLVGGGLGFMGARASKYVGQVDRAKAEVEAVAGLAGEGGEAIYKAAAAPAEVYQSAHLYNKDRFALLEDLVERGAMGDPEEGALWLEARREILDEAESAGKRAMRAVDAKVLSDIPGRLDHLIRNGDPRRVQKALEAVYVDYAAAVQKLDDAMRPGQAEYRRLLDLDIDFAGKVPQAEDDVLGMVETSGEAVTKGGPVQATVAGKAPRTPTDIPPTPIPGSPVGKTRAVTNSQILESFDDFAGFSVDKYAKAKGISFDDAMAQLSPDDFRAAAKDAGINLKEIDAPAANNESMFGRVSEIMGQRNKDVVGRDTKLFNELYDVMNKEGADGALAKLGVARDEIKGLTQAEKELRLDELLKKRLGSDTVPFKAGAAEEASLNSSVREVSGQRAAAMDNSAKRFNAALIDEKAFAKGPNAPRRNAAIDDLLDKIKQKLGAQAEKDSAAMVQAERSLGGAAPDLLTPVPQPTKNIRASREPTVNIRPTVTEDVPFGVADAPKFAKGSPLVESTRPAYLDALDFWQGVNRESKASLSPKLTDQIDHALTNLEELTGGRLGTPALRAFAEEVGMDLSRLQGPVAERAIALWSLKRLAKGAAEASVSQAKNGNGVWHKAAKAAIVNLGGFKGYKNFGVMGGVIGRAAGGKLADLVLSGTGALARMSGVVREKANRAVAAVLTPSAVRTASHVAASMSTSYMPGEPNTRSFTKKANQLQQAVATPEPVRAKIRQSLEEVQKLDPRAALEAEEVAFDRIKKLAVRLPNFMARGPMGLPALPTADLVAEWELYEAITHDPDVAMDMVRAGRVDDVVMQALEEQHPEYLAEVVNQLLADPDKLRRAPMHVLRALSKLTSTVLVPEADPFYLEKQQLEYEEEKQSAETKKAQQQATSGGMSLNQMPMVVPLPGQVMAQGNTGNVR